MARKLWTDSDKEFLIREFPNVDTQALADKMDRTYSSISGMAYVMGLKKSEKYMKEVQERTVKNLTEKGKANRFKKGQRSWNKGMKGVYFGGRETQFKPGQRPHNWKPLGSERITSDGYIEFKYKDERKATSNYMLKHRFIWEQVHGEIPEGYVLNFKDGDSLNCEIDNLMLVSMVENLKTNRFSDSAVAKRYLGVKEDVQGFIEGNKELLEVKRLEIKLTEKINEYERYNKKIRGS